MGRRAPAGMGRNWGMRRRSELRSVWGLYVLEIRGSGVVVWTGLRFGEMFGDCKPGDENYYGNNGNELVTFFV